MYDYPGRLVMNSQRTGDAGTAAAEAAFLLRNAAVTALQEAGIQGGGGEGAAGTDVTLVNSVLNTQPVFTTEGSAVSSPNKSLKHTHTHTHDMCVYLHIQN